MKLYIALLHYPVYNKDGKIVTTAIANMDLHDIARVAKTYGVKNFYIVNSVAAQRVLACEIMSHWQKGYGAEFNESRKDAFELVAVKENLTEVISEITRQEGAAPLTIATSASFKEKFITCAQLKKRLQNDNLPYLIIFGTGSGIGEEIINKMDYCLEPIKGVGNYNHLSVRSAAAIILDRISEN